MSMIKTYLGLLAPVLLLVLAGCASSSPEPEPQVEAPVVTEAVQEVVVEIEPIKPMVSGGRVIIPLDELDASAGSRTLAGVFYFDFDQAIVRRDGHAELDQHAMVLAGNSGLTVRLEGHADERGTREYNLALGERRANAVQSYLLSQGASRSQIEVVSYGEEKPAMSGHDQASWEKNRRVEIVYR
ncbi:MAG: peptidoglycan-associated lipoprotein Pal [Pseudomonadales bacterium]